MSYKFNVFTGTFDIVGVAADTTPGGAASVWVLEIGGYGWLMEDGSSFWLTEA